MGDDAALGPSPYGHVLDAGPVCSLSRADPLILLWRWRQLDTYDVGTPFADHLTYCIHASGQRDSNPRSSAWKADAVPPQLCPLIRFVIIADARGLYSLGVLNFGVIWLTEMRGAESAEDM